MSILKGKRVLVTRPKEQSQELIEKLLALGADPIPFPTIEIAPIEDTSKLDHAIADLKSYDWVIFTSINGVAAFWVRLTAVGKDAADFDGVKTAAIGPATAQALAQRGVQPNFVPDKFIAEAILTGLGDVNKKRILLPRADIARENLFNELKQLGALPTEIHAYHTIPAQLNQKAFDWLKEGIDVLTFTSSSTVRNFVHIFHENGQPIPVGIVVACIGPITAATADEYGLQVDIIADEYTTSGLVKALLAYFEKQSEKGA